MIFSPRASLALPPALRLHYNQSVDNRALATILSETADLLEIAGEDSFRVHSYRNAAEAIEGWTRPIAEIVNDNKALLAIPGIGKGMAANLQEICREGHLNLHEDLLQKYRPTILELLKINGLGPKTIALIWSAFHVSDPEAVAQLARDGKLRTLPRMSEKLEQKILHNIEAYRSMSGRFHLDDADHAAERLTEHLAKFPGVAHITPAGSLRRGRETVGDLDLLVTGRACESSEGRAKVIERVLTFPGIVETLVKGDNKVSFKLRSGMQVDVRLLATSSYGAALQYFTGSKSHNVQLRQRALRMGFTLNEYGLFRLGKDGKAQEGKPPAAAATEEEIYAKLGLDWIPPEMRENNGEIELAEKHQIPKLVTVEDIRGEVHMHTVETDGKNTIEEMARAARERGYKYIAITEHSKNLAFANGLDDKRALKHIARIRKTAEQIEGIAVMTGIEVDILADGELDLSDEVLAQMDVVIASVHSAFQQPPAKMTERLVRAVSHKHVTALGHPTGRLLLRREANQFDMAAVLDAAKAAGTAMELNAYPDRLDLNDVHLRMARERGIKVLINCDAHSTLHFEKIKYGVLQARRAWLTKADVLNTLPLAEFRKAIAR